MKERRRREELEQQQQQQERAAKEEEEEEEGKAAQTAAAAAAARRNTRGAQAADSAGGEAPPETTTAAAPHPPTPCLHWDGPTDTTAAHVRQVHEQLDAFLRARRVGCDGGAELTQSVRQYNLYVQQRVHKKTTENPPRRRVWRSTARVLKNKAAKT
jgi:hypothetical protein